MGEDWLDDLDRKKSTITKATIGYYRSVIEEYENKDR